MFATLRKSRKFSQESAWVCVGEGKRSFLFFSPRATGDLKRDHSRGEFLESTCRGSRTPKTSSPLGPLARRLALARRVVAGVCSSTTARPSGAIRAATRLEFRHGNRLECARWNRAAGVKCTYILRRHVAVLFLYLSSRGERCVLKLRVACAGVRERCSRKNPIHRRRNERSRPRERERRGPGGGEGGVRRNDGRKRMEANAAIWIRRRRQGEEA